jgi:hypothetical protein
VKERETQEKLDEHAKNAKAYRKKADEYAKNAETLRQGRKQAEALRYIGR